MMLWAAITFAVTINIVELNYLLVAIDENHSGKELIGLKNKGIPENKTKSIK